MDRESENERRRKLRAERKSKDLCPRCGKPAVNGYSLCESCRAEDKMTYQWYESYGFCPKCHADAAPGRKLCAVCLERESERNAKRRISMTDEQRKARNESIEKIKKKRVESGICRDCGKRPAWSGRQRCYECTLKHRKRCKGRKAKYEYKDLNGCFRCGQPCVPGKRLCPKHYQIDVEKIKKARESDNFKLAQKRNKQKVNAMWGEMIWNAKHATA